MKTIEYTITDELGIHARPAGMLVKEAAKFQSKIMVASPKITHYLKDCSFKTAH